MEIKDTKSIHNRVSKVQISDFATPCCANTTMSQFIDSLPNQLMAKDFKMLVDNVAEHKGITLVGMGAHVIKAGLSPIIRQAIRHGLIDGILMNGACVIHDTEIAIAGHTSEDVDTNLWNGCFGASKEAANFINASLNKHSFGHSISRAIHKSGLIFKNESILNEAFVNCVPVFVHVAIGTDTIHMYPETNGALVGESSLSDFRDLCNCLKHFDNGTFINFGSAVIIPEVFIKAMSVAINNGCKLNNITTANFDFIKHYRPDVNVVKRPATNGCHIIGPHEIMIPLFFNSVMTRKYHETTCLR